jgi:hypothetical protein
MIAILCPTRGRERAFLRMCESAHNTSENDVYIFSGSNGGDAYASVQYPTDMPTCYMWNDLAKAAMKHPHNKLFMLGADDTVFATPHWDSALIEHYNALENKIHVYHLQDSRDKDGTPHPIVTREYINALGYFMPPIFMHWYVDTWTVGIAKANACFTHLRDYMLVHDKPSDRGEPDETHNGIRRMGWAVRDRAVWESCADYFELDIARLKTRTYGRLVRSA